MFFLTYDLQRNYNINEVDVEGKTKKIILLTITGVFIFAAIFIPLTFFVFLREDVLPSPNNPIVTVTNTKLSIETDEIKGAKQYLFNITNPSGNVLKVYSEHPSIYIEMLNPISGEFFPDFSEAGEYKVTCSAIAKKSVLDSKESSVTSFERYIKIKTPAINLLNEEDITQLFWERVKNATSYELQINSLNSSEIYTFSPSSNPSGIETLSLTNIFKTLTLPADNYQLIVVANNTQNSYFIQSEESNPILFKFE